MTFAVTVHALLAAIRSARAFVHKVAIVWPLPALLPEDAPLDDARSRQKPETTAVHRCADSMRADYLLQTVERLRVNLDEMRAQRDQALEALAGRAGVPRDRLTVRRAARDRMPLGGADAQALEGALQQVEREFREAIAQRDKARAERDEATKELDELDTGGVVAALRTDRERLRALDAALGSEGEPLQSIHAMREMLGSVDGETLLAAVHRATRAVRAAVRAQTIPSTCGACPHAASLPPDGARFCQHPDGRGVPVAHFDPPPAACPLRKASGG